MGWVGYVTRKYEACKLELNSRFRSRSRTQIPSPSTSKDIEYLRKVTFVKLK